MTAKCPACGKLFPTEGHFYKHERNGEMRRVGGWVGGKYRTWWELCEAPPAATPEVKA